jgi:hypothetical protein
MHDTPLGGGCTARQPSAEPSLGRLAHSLGVMMNEIFEKQGNIPILSFSKWFVYYY